ncbi:MAG: STAS domain-containing protein [Desulfobulbus sp.]|nr:STAS domain-containing protein [Desulfobulbus sp.]
MPPKVPEEAPASLAEPLPELEFTRSKTLAASGPAAKPSAPLGSVIAPNLGKDDFDDAEFIESEVMDIDVNQDIDPVQGDVEHAVVLFANGQEAAARSLLETLIRAYPGDEGRRFWLLLLDLLQCVGDHAAFENLALEFAETWETSPSSWRRTEPAAAGKNHGPRRLVLQGVLTAENVESLNELAEWAAKGQPVVIECGKLAGCDDAVAGQLAAILRTARRDGVALTLNEVNGFLARLNERLRAGEAGREPAWALLLELLQRQGPQELFEERAVDYAVTFELSPPSWENAPAAKPEAGAALPVDDAYYLEGDLKNCRFDELVDVIENNELPVIDFSGVRRMDFFSAGQLVNRIAPYKAEGREILIRSPNHLVAELMAVVGLNKQARIIIPKS